MLDKLFIQRKDEPLSRYLAGAEISEDSKSVAAIWEWFSVPIDKVCNSRIVIIIIDWERFR